MIPTSKTLDIFIAIVFLDKPLEVVSREEIAQLRENISTLVHEYFASNCKFGAKILISKVGSGFFAQNISIYACFRELLMDFSGQ